MKEKRRKNGVFSAMRARPAFPGRALQCAKENRNAPETNAGGEKPAEAAVWNREQREFRRLSSSIPTMRREKTVGLLFACFLWHRNLITEWDALSHLSVRQLRGHGDVSYGLAATRRFPVSVDSVNSTRNRNGSRLRLVLLGVDEFVDFLVGF